MVYSFGASTAFTSSQKTAMEERLQPTTIHVAPSGDFKLLVEQDKSSLFAPKPQCIVTNSFLVSSAVMTLASPVWKVMFDPHSRFKEATEKEVRFLDDDPDMLLLLLRIAHLQFRELPSSLDYRQLLGLATLCDKYDTVHLVRPWLPQWEQPLSSPDDCCEQENLIFIAWTFGDVETFEKWAEHLAMECYTTPTPGQCCIRPGVQLEENMAPGIVASILEVRRQTIKSLLDLCDKYFERYSNNVYVCQVKDSRPEPMSRTARTSLVPPWGEYNRQCDAMVFGCLLKGLKHVGLWPRPIESDIHMSVRTLSQKLYSLTCYALVEKENHERCKFTNGLSTGVENYLECMPSAVLDSHRKHMEEQKKK